MEWWQTAYQQHYYYCHISQFGIFLKCDIPQRKYLRYITIQNCLSPQQHKYFPQGVAILDMQRVIIVVMTSQSELNAALQHGLYDKQKHCSETAKLFSILLTKILKERNVCILSITNKCLVSCPWPVCHIYHLYTCSEGDSAKYSPEMMIWNIIIEGEYFAKSPEERVYKRFIILKELNDKV